MKLLRKENLIAILGVLVLLSFSISFWLFSGHLGMSLRPINYYNNMDRRSTVGYINGLNKPGEELTIRQHGQYWILYNYIKAAKEFTGNESVTLVVNCGNWSSIIKLEETFKRWHGPITLTISTDGEDFERIISALAYHTKCTSYGAGFFEFVSVNIIMHQDFLPQHIAWKDLGTTFSNVNCTEIRTLLLSDLSGHKAHNLAVPIYLVRNVGRLTARTHFVLLLDADMTPSAGIPELFLKMIKATRNSDHSQKSIYVLPYFELEYDTVVPESKLSLTTVYQESLKLYLNSISLHKIPRLREWVETNNKSATEIFHRTREWGRRLAYYISANDIEPFYDESCNREPETSRIAHLNLLEALHYNFYTINLGFIVHHYNGKFYTEIPALDDMQCQTNLQSLIYFYRNFI